MGFADTIKKRSIEQAKKTLNVNKNSFKDKATGAKTLSQIATGGKAKAEPVAKRRTATKKPVPSATPAKPNTSVTKAIKDSYKQSKGSSRAERKDAIKSAAKEAFENKKKKLASSFKKHAEKTIDGGVQMVLQNAGLQWATKKVGEAALLTTIMAIDAAGGDPLYKYGFCIKEFLKRDYASIIAYLINKHNYSVTNGKEASYFNAIRYGATKCAMLILQKKKEVKGDRWYQENRYAEIKKIILRCYTNFISGDIMHLMATGYSLLPDSPIEMASNGAPNEAGVAYQRKTLPSGYGENGCDEFKTRYKFTKSEVNLIFPEKKTAHGIPVTYPKTVEHYTLFKALMSKAIYGEDRLIHELLDIRVNKNLVYTPATKEAIEMADEALAESGLDKLIHAIQNKHMLMYTYVKWLISEKYI